MSAHGHNTDDEMHELNFEADYLEQGGSKKPNGNSRDRSDPDAQAMVTESLRNQVQDLVSQVTQLNSKLVKSYDRVSDLEDELHVSAANLRASTVKVSNLELERSQHLSALSTGLLVERDHVTTELTRLMEKATEEAARRGQAESARAEIEQELDDLSAGLFDQANRMVAEARLARARSERKAEETEVALRGAEEIVGVLQAQMQALQAKKEQSEQEAEEMRALMGKGKWVARPEPTQQIQLRYRSSHPPYAEYLQFIGHLRFSRSTNAPVPLMTSLLPLPFLARLVAEDSDPTVRLDLAPSLNWLTRRSVLSAIHSGQLAIEPMSTQTLLEELTPSAIPTLPHHTHINCALCGTFIFEPAQSSLSRPPQPQSPSRNGTWSSAFKSSLQTIATAAQTAANGRLATSAPFAEPPAQVYIFRLESTSSGLPVSLPRGSQQSTGQNRPTIYPLCTSDWCLMRLRATCSLWAFIRTKIVEKIWEEGTPASAPPIETHKPAATTMSRQNSTASTTSDSQQSLASKRSRMGIGALWGTMQRGLSGTKGDESPKSLTSKIEESSVVPEKGAPKPPPTTRRLPPPPPRHPPLSQPIPRRSNSSSIMTDITIRPTPPATPPPLPKRSRPQDLRPTSLVITNPPQAADISDPNQTVPVRQESVDRSLLVSPPIELVRSESHDQFSTPVEELSSPHLAHTTPPRSSSESPTPIAETSRRLSQTQFNTRPDFSDDKHADASARETSPLPTAPTPPPARRVLPTLPPAPIHPPVDSVPSRTGSPAPPPIPRRAAARARPISMIGTPAARRTATATPEPVASVDPPKVETQETRQASPEVPKSSAPPALEPSETDALLLSNRIGTPDRAVNATPESDSGVDANLDKLEEVVLSTPQGEPEELVVQTPVRQLTPPSVNTEEEPQEGQPLSDLHHSSEPQDADDDGIYASDATWEERTWKELARLREDMFYAKLGCVR